MCSRSLILFLILWQLTTTLSLLFWSNLVGDEDSVDVAVLVVDMCDKPNRGAESSFGYEAATGGPSVTSDSSVIELFSCSNWLGCAKSASPCNIIRLKFGALHAQQIQEASDLFKQEYSQVVMHIQSLCCDQCDLWYHTECMGMTTVNYEALLHSSCSWICCQCGLPNFASSLFQDSLSQSNSFDCLSSLSSDNNGALTPGPPLAASSPNRTLNSGPMNNGSRSNNVSRANCRSLKAMVINFGSIKNKASALAVTLENYHPDIVFGTETHLNVSINSSEIFPPNYAVFRKDRDIGTSGGGVLVAIRSDLIATHRIDLDTDCEIVWVTIKIQGSKSITVGAFYRSQKYGATSAYLDQLRQSLAKIKGTTGNQIWLAGDFNLPDINWDNCSFIPGGAYPALSKQMTNYK